MKRTLISVLAAFGLLLGMSLPVSASLELPIRIDCSDGDSIDLSVDANTLTALTSSVAAINASDTDLTCSLVQLALPTLVFHSANEALAASSGYVIGAGTVEAGCPPDFSRTFIGSFSVKMYWKNGTLSGSGNLSIGAGQCAAAGKLSSRPTCLVTVASPAGIGGQAWANSFVTSTSGFFTRNTSTTIGWGFDDNGPNGGTVVKDRWRVVEHPGSCPLVGDPSPQDFYTVRTGDVTVR
jgi:hypothetical protein